jgi:hypothetical protein
LSTAQRPRRCSSRWGHFDSKGRGVLARRWRGACRGGRPRLRARRPRLLQLIATCTRARRGLSGPPIGKAPPALGLVSAADDVS